MTTPLLRGMSLVAVLCAGCGGARDSASGAAVADAPDPTAARPASGPAVAGPRAGLTTTGARAPLGPIAGLPLPPSDTGRADTGADPDADGWSAAQGDCGPARPGRHPGAIERCNGRDDDCDGLIDEPGARALVPVRSKNEGAVWTATLRPTGCVDTWTLAAAPAPDLAACTVETAEGGRSGASAQLRCALKDEGPLAVLIAVSGPHGRSHVAVQGAATNVPPEVFGDTTPISVVLDPGNDSGTAEATEAAPTRRVFRAADLGRFDAITWSVEGGPPHLQIDASGVLRFHPDDEDLGAWRAVVRATDDAGAVGERALYVDVRRGTDADGGLGCCCFGATAALGLPGLSLLRHRRRRQHAQG